MDQYNFSQQNNSVVEPAFQYNGAMTNVNIDNALAGILDRFDEDYVMDVVKRSIEKRFRPYDQKMPNVVYGFEQQFVSIFANFGSNNDDVAQKRQEVYVDIINTLCVAHNFTFNAADDMDYYSAAYYLYQFLVSEYTTNIITFFTNFLITERNGIYQSLNLAEFRKNDMALHYSKKIFRDEKLGMIHGCMAYVMDNIQSFDIDFYSVLNHVYADKSIARYIYSLVVDNMNFFKSFYMADVLNPKISADLQTLIKMNLQTCAANIEPIQ